MANTMKDHLIIANWKNNASRDGVEKWCRHIAQHFSSYQERRLCVCPPLPYLQQFRSHNLPLSLGAQDISAYPQGAYTGEVSGDMLKENGCEYVLTGHSERRTLLKESEELLAQKLKQATAHRLVPVFCVGETHKQYQAGETKSIIKKQLQSVMDMQNSTDMVIAYEPVWAIGTGLAASPEYADEMHSFIKQELPDGTRVLYGGSINAKNAQAFLAMRNSGGLLVGGASLDADSILKIYRS